jgi:hypothetical protein
MSLANPNISRESLRKKKPETFESPQPTSIEKKPNADTSVTIVKHVVCNACGNKTPLKQVFFCQACSQTPYCSAKCRTKDIRFHQEDCEPQDIIEIADDDKVTYTKPKFDVSSDSDAKDSDDNILILEILKKRLDKDVVNDISQMRRNRKRKVVEDSDSDFDANPKKRN